MNPTPTSVRLPPDLLARVDTWAEDRGLSRHGALVQLVAEGLAVTGERDGDLLSRVLTHAVDALPAEDAERVRAAVQRAIG